MRETSEIIEIIRIKKSLKVDKEVATVLGMEPDALSAHKNRGTLPFKQLVAFCEAEGISFDYLVMGNDKMSGLSITRAKGSKNDFIPQNDKDIKEIVEYLKDSPRDKQIVLKLVKAKKNIDQAVENVIDGVTSGQDGSADLKT